MRTILAAAAVVALGIAPAAADCDPGETVVKFSHVVAASGNPKGEAAEALAKRVNEEMQGELCMQVFPNSQLLDDDKVMEAILLGDVQLAAPDTGKFGAYTKKLDVLNLPFLFGDIAAVDSFVETEPGSSLLNAMQDSGFVGLGFLHNGMRQFSADRPLLQPSDAKGLKFRITTSDVSEAMIEALGATPQKLAFKEVYGALQTGVVDGQENTWSNIWTQKFFEVQDGITETNHQLLTYLLVTSEEFLDSLEPDVREQFVTIVEEIAREYSDKASAINEDAKQKIINAGGTVRELTPEQRQAWVDAMKPVWSQFEDQIGADLIEAAQQANGS